MLQRVLSAQQNFVQLALPMSRNNLQLSVNTHYTTTDYFKITVVAQGNLLPMEAAEQ